MTALLSASRLTRRRLTAGLAGLALALGTAGCTGTLPGNVHAPGTQPTETPPVSGETIGTGQVRVAMLLPLSAGGNAASVGQVFKNSATLALDGVQGHDLTLLIKDTGGTASGAATAARQALSEGAELILGPVFSDSVRAAGEVARSANRPLIGFSSDPNAAAPGVYLLSFLTGNDVRRVVTYAGQTGKRSYVALLPNDAFGQVAEAAFRESVPQAGGRILQIERYTADPTNPAATEADVRAKAQALAQMAKSADAVFIPQGAVAPLAVDVLRSQGVAAGPTQILGTGTWDDPRILASGNLAGAVFAAPDNTGFEEFAARYRQRFGATPPRTASLAADATVLAAGLVRGAGARRFDRVVLTNPDGFIGTDGVFRLLQNGLNERGLAIYQISGGQMRVLEPAPRTFR